MSYFLEGLGGRIAGRWLLGKSRGLFVVHHGRLVERVTPAAHTLDLVRSTSPTLFFAAARSVVAESDMSPPGETYGLWRLNALTRTSGSLREYVILVTF